MLLNPGDMFNFTSSGYVLLQMNLDWYETEWPKNLNKQEIIKMAKAKSIEITDIHDYFYRGKISYWLFHFTNRNTKFSEVIPQILEKERETLIKSSYLFR